MTMITGMFSSMSARGPCFNSPARIPDNPKARSVPKKRLENEQTFGMHITNLLDLQGSLKAGGMPRRGTITLAVACLVKIYLLVTTGHEQKTGRLCKNTLSHLLERLVLCQYSAYLSRKGM